MPHNQESCGLYPTPFVSIERSSNVLLQVKPVGSTFVGTSPEFEMALYTICFLCGPEGDSTDEIAIDDYDVVVTCYKHGLNLGTSFPKEAPQ